MSGKYDKLEAALRSTRMSAINEITAGERSGTDIIATEALLPAWRKEGPQGDGSHAVGEPCTHVGQIWKCCQAHNTNNNPDIEPSKSAAFWVPYHTTDPTRAKQFIQPTMTEDSYFTGEVCIYDGKTYRSTMAGANAYSPADYPAGWAVVEEGGSV